MKEEKFEREIGKELELFLSEKQPKEITIHTNLCLDRGYMFPTEKGGVLVLTSGTIHFKNPRIKGSLLVGDNGAIHLVWINAFETMEE